MKLLVLAMAMLLVAGYAMAQSPNENNTILIFKADGTYDIYRAYTHRNHTGRDANTIIFPPSYFDPNTGGNAGTYSNPARTQQDWTAPLKDFYQLAKYENDINTGDYVDPQKYRKATLKELIEKYEENYSHQAGYLDKTKGKKKREMPINNTLAELFRIFRKKQGLTFEYVFVYQGNRIKDVKTAYNAALKRAGILDANFHTLRHTFASHFGLLGGSLKALQEMLGHANIKTTMRYAHLSQEHKKEAVKLLDGLTTSNSMSFYVTNSEKSGLAQNSQPTAGM